MHRTGAGTPHGVQYHYGAAQYHYGAARRIALHAGLQSEIDSNNGPDCYRQTGETYKNNRRCGFSPVVIRLLPLLLGLLSCPS